MVDFLTPRVQAALWALSPRKLADGMRCFPEACAGPNKVRMSATETAKSGLLKVCAALENPESSFLHERIALFGYASWNRQCLVSLGLQAFCLMEGSLESAYSNSDSLEESDCHYFRLDLHTNAMGLLFKETFPHLHVNPKLEPRIPYVGKTDETLIPDFISFLFRNYAYEDWYNWLEGLWAKKMGDLVLDDPLPAVYNAFRDSNLVLLLNQLSEPVGKIKLLIHQATKEAASNFRPLPSNFEHMNL